MFTVNGRKKIIYGKDFVGTITITVSTGTSDDQTVNEGIKSIQFPSLFGDLGETISFDPATYLTDTYSYEYFVPAGATHAGSFNVTLTTENGTKIHAPFDLICESSAPLISDLNLNSGLFASFVVGDILYHGESSYGTLTVSVNATEPEPDANNGYSKVDVVIFPSLASSDTSSDDTSPYSHTWSPITLTGEDDGIYTITAIDNFGNSSFKTFQIISDSTGPDVILDISDAPGMVFIVNWSAHDRDVAPGIPGSGVDHYQARLVPANTSCDSISVIAELDNGSTQKTSVEIADSGVNTPKLCVRAYDRVGNAGAWAEKQPEVVTETAYYPFNGQSVAMSRNGQTYYFGTDHLGSISVTVRQDGTVASEMRYEPYGQVRWIKGTVLSDKSYTGQRSESGFGLMDYNARYYDPSIMQFQQPDTLVPDPYNPLDWNRYSYARYNPIKYTDPTGHGTVCYEDGYCGDAPIYSKEHLDYLRRLYGIVFMGSWDSGDDSNKDQWSVVFGVQAMAEGLSGRSGGNAASTFRQVYGIANGQKFNFEWGCSECIGFAITMGPRHIKFGGMYTNPLSNVTLVVHELFHAFENAMLPDGADFKEARNALPDNIVNGDGLMPPTDRRWQHRIDGDGRGEIFADMGVGWIFDAWNLLGNQLTVDAANAKRDWMNQQMGEYIQSAISNQRQ